MSDRSCVVTLRDSTLREGLDTPGVDFSLAARLRIAHQLDALRVPEAEVVAPARVSIDLDIARELALQDLDVRLTGLVYANQGAYREHAAAASEVLDRFDLIMPLSGDRDPPEFASKIERLQEALEFARTLSVPVGLGLPHATQVDIEATLRAAQEGAASGASRITIYDTNGSADPFTIRRLIEEVTAVVDIPVFFHGHNDLGLAVANSWAAVLGGATGLDVTLCGLGDRAGNASLEQSVVLLHLQGFSTGIQTTRLQSSASLVAELSGIPVSPLAPIVGSLVFDHKSPAHSAAPAAFEAFDPAWVGGRRRIVTGDDS